MTTVYAQQNISTIHQANFLTPTAVKNQSSLKEKVTLLGASLRSLAEAVERAVLGALSLAGYFITLGCWQKAKHFGNEQLQKAAHAKSVCFQGFCSILSTKKVSPAITAAKDHLLLEPAHPLTPEMRALRVRQGAERIANKLQRQLERAQNQAAQEPDKAFQYFPAPSNFEGSCHTERVSGYEVGVCHFIGRRPTMEDEHLATSFNLNIHGAIYPVQIFGIFDGHGGNAASIYVRENLTRELHQTLNEFCANGLTDEAIWNALKITFVRLNAKFNEPQSGTTVTLAMILNKQLWTADVGDSRTILDNGVQLSEDAKPTDPYYRKGIENRGGVVLFHRVNGNLAVARAVGDHKTGGAIGPYKVGAVNPRPKITVYPVVEGRQLILSCDGIFDVSSTRQIAATAQAHRDLPAEELAKNIVYSAYQAQSGDNLSVLIVKL